MAHETSVKTMIRQIAEASKKLAVWQEWSPDDYKVFVRVNQDWGYVHVVVAARSFLGETPRAKWEYVMGYLEGALFEDGRSSSVSISLTLRTFEEIDQGGIYSLSPSFEDVDEILAGGVA